MAYCDEYIALISASLDGALSPEEAEKLNAHLARCPECRRLSEELSALHTALGDLPPVEVPADLTGRIMEAVAAEKIVPFAPPEKKRSPVRWQRWLASAAVLAVVLMGTWSWRPWDRDAQRGAAPAAPAPLPVSEAAPGEETLPAVANDLTENGTEPAAAGSAADAQPTLKVAPKMAQPTPQAAGGFMEDQTAPAAPAEAAPAESFAPEDPGANSLPSEEDGKTVLLSPTSLEEPETVQVPILFSAAPTLTQLPLPVESEPPPELPRETLSPMVRSFLPTNGALPSSPEETPETLTAREALDRLLEEYPMPGCESWELEDIEPGWRSPEWTPLDGERSWLEYSGSESYGDKTYHIFGEWVTPFDEGPESVGCSVSYAVLADSGEILLAGN